jgi:hypothetical protein
MIRQQGHDDVFTAPGPIPHPVTHRHCKSGHAKRKIPACEIFARPESAATA